MKTPTALVAAFMAVVCWAVPVRTQSPSTSLYLVATAHLDSQWNWTVQDTIRDHIPKTFYTNFDYFEKYPHYNFSWEGAIHYMWFKEYHPDDWATVQKYVAANRWRLAGSWIDAVDANMPSPESIFRQALYAQRFFRQEFQKVSRDVYLPDCFGFPFSLPSLAVASGLNAFSTQKLTWGRPIPFPIGRWKGVDGSEVVAALNPHSYTSNIAGDINADPVFATYTDDPTPIGGGRSVAFRYFGTGDTGGGPREDSVQNLEKSLANPVQRVDIRNVAPDQLAKDLTPAERAALPEYASELILKTHGTGCYTSQAAMKRFNRANELLADAAERAGVAAEYLTGVPYPTERLREAWIRFLWHQFHDDLTGTCLPEAYQFSWNDEIASLNQFASVLTSSMTSVASVLDTSGAGVPLVVYNPLSIERHEPVEAVVKLGNAGAAGLAVKVTDDATGLAVSSQVLSANGADTHVLFRADVPSNGFRVYHVAMAPQAAAAETSMKVSSTSLENNRLSVKIDANGDVSSIYDKDAKHELLKAPVMLELRDNPSTSWPAWEVLYETVQAPAREYVSNPTVKVIERGPVRIGIEITRKGAGSTFVQRVRLTEGGDRVDVENLVDWKSPNSVLKASFPFSAGNTKATYDLGLGTIDRTGNEPDKYEVPAQKWANIDDVSGEYGVGVINDSKHGWDKPNDHTLRLTLIHTPKPGGSYTYQSSNDLGHHRFVYAIAGHAGDWRQGRLPTRAWQVNQPLVAFQTAAHQGPLGRAFSLASITSTSADAQSRAVDAAGQVAIVAMKKAEDSDEIVVRLQERFGQAANVTLRFAGQITAARELNAAEELIGPLQLGGRGGGGGGAGRGGNAPAPNSFPTVQVALKAYQPKTIAVKLLPAWEAPPATGRGGPPAAVLPSRPAPRATATVALPFNLDGVSADTARSDGNFDGKGRTLAAELLPERLTLDGVPFAFGSGAAGAKNVLVPDGQTLALPAGSFTRAYVIAAAVGGDVNATFGVGAGSQTMAIREWQGPVGQWDSRLKSPHLLQEALEPPGTAPSRQSPAPTGQRNLWGNAAIQDDIVVKWDPTTGAVSGMDQIRPAFLKRDEIAWIGGHRHRPQGNEIYIASYLFKYAIDLPRDTHEIRLPKDPRVRILAVSVADEPAPAVPAGVLYLADIPESKPAPQPAMPAKSGGIR